MSDESQLLDALRLGLVPGIGPRLEQSLLDAFGTPAGILSASSQELEQVDGIGRSCPQRLPPTAIRPRPSASGTLPRNGRSPPFKGGADYPRMLAEICDPPSLLYCRGTIEPRDELAVAIVRSALRFMAVNRPSGLRRRWHGRESPSSADCAGNRRGGSSRGAEAAGRTIAVAACGLAQVYPPEHKELAAQIAESGAVVANRPSTRNRSPASSRSGTALSAAYRWAW